MASAAAAALSRAALLLLLLALSLFSTAAVESHPVPNICNLPAGTVPRENCSAFRCARPDPVCGVNSVTYVCGCGEANACGVRVVKRGRC